MTLPFTFKQEKGECFIDGSMKRSCHSDFFHPVVDETFATCEIVSLSVDETFATCEIVSLSVDETFATCEIVSLSVVETIVVMENILTDMF